MNFIMAFNNLSKSIRLLFLKKLTKSFLSHIQVSKSLKPIFKSKIIMPPYKNLILFKNLLPLHKNILMKGSNVYENDVNQNKSQTRYSTHSTKDEEKLPLGRHQFHKETENLINEQIGAELHAAFSYLSMACYFGHTDIALAGCQGFFLNMYEEELEHAMVFINYQLLRGGHVVLPNINVPKSHDWKSVNNAFCAALDTEKLVKEKLVCLFETAEKHKDLEVMDIVSTQFMKEQNKSIRELARLLKKSEMTTDPMGEYLFDKMLYNSFVKNSKNSLIYKKELEESEDKVYE